MSMAPDSRFASRAAVFSITRTTMRRNAGFLPHHFGFGSNTTWEPGSTAAMR